MLHRCNINDNHIMHESWDTEPVSDRTFCHFGAFFALTPPNNPKNQNFEKYEKTTWRYYHFTHVYKNNNRLMYGSWDVERDGENFMSFWIFCCLLCPNNPENQNFDKLKKTPGDIIISNVCTIYDNHMMYGSWDIKRYGPNFLLFWTIFCPFTALTTQKIKTLKKWRMKKAPGDIIISDMCTTNDNHDVWFMRYEAWQTELFAILDYFFPFTL